MVTFSSFLGSFSLKVIAVRNVAAVFESFYAAARNTLVSAPFSDARLVLPLLA